MNDDIEDLLREGMDRFANDLRAPAGLVFRAQQRRRRRLALRSAGGVAALTAGAAALVVTAVPTTAGLSAKAGTTVNAAYVVKQVGSALTTAEPGDIAQLTITTTGPSLLSGVKATTTTAQMWSYGKQWREVIYSSPGHPAFEEGANASSVYTLVNYQAKTWARLAGFGQPTKLPVVSATDKDGCWPAFGPLPVLFRLGLPGIGSVASSAPATATSALRNAVSCGTLKVAGHQRVDGVNAVKLQSSAGSLISETIWVDPGSYLPVRVVANPSAGGFGVKQTADISWLPPTAQNLADLTMSAPASFRHVTFSQAGLPIVQKLPTVLLPTQVAVCPAGSAVCKVRGSGALRLLLPPKPNISQKA